MADGAGGGQHALVLEQRRSSQCRDSVCQCDKASARPFALWRGGTHDTVAACEPQGLDAKHEARSGEGAAG